MYLDFVTIPCANSWMMDDAAFMSTAMLEGCFITSDGCLHTVQAAPSVLVREVILYKENWYAVCVECAWLVTVTYHTSFNK
jgi:hypothetical protein